MMLEKEAHQQSLYLWRKSVFSNSEIFGNIFLCNNLGFLSKLENLFANNLGVT
jgi:hypothetical protein